MSVRASVRCQNFQNPTAPRERWADVDETWHVYSMVHETKLLGSRILNFALHYAGEMTHPNECLLYLFMYLMP